MAEEPRTGPSLLAALARRLGYGWLLPVLFSPFLFFFVLKATHLTPSASGSSELSPWGGTLVSYVTWVWIAIFSSALFFGALGATVSFFSRAEGDVLSKRTVLAAQLFGSVFALVLTLMFVGGLIQGSLFPTFGTMGGTFRWTSLSFDLAAWARLMVWSFIAGFSERFVPDLLNRLIQRSAEDDRPDRD
ncbi:MAG: hypothetical protein V4574_16285 [Pseudomonadota bacterium]